MPLDSHSQSWTPAMNSANLRYLDKDRQAIPPKSRASNFHKHPTGKQSHVPFKPLNTDSDSLELIIFANSWHCTRVYFKTLSCVNCDELINQPLWEPRDSDCQSHMHVWGMFGVLSLYKGSVFDSIIRRESVASWQLDGAICVADILSLSRRYFVDVFCIARCLEGCSKMFKVPFQISKYVHTGFWHCLTVSSDMFWLILQICTRPQD